MKILNLVDLEKSEIKYTIQKFPDGQQNIILINDGKLPLLIDPIKIKTRLNNWLDLELIVAVVACLKEIGYCQIHLYIPYIVGARSDRKFEVGGNNYLRDVLCPIINSLNFKSVTCIDPHSDVLEGCIKGFRKESNLELVKYSISEIYNIDRGEISDNMILVSPDAGASKKIYKIAKQIGYKGDIITCSKDRDKDGNLTKCVVPMSTIVNKDYILIDDICDGGATFNQIGSIIKPLLHKSNRLFLVCTHGIFSKGFGELQQYFDGIYTTNSYQDLNPDTQSFVKQLNIF